MALWKDNAASGTATATPPAPTKDAATMTPPAEAAVKHSDYAPDITPSTSRRASREMKESVIAAEITITGKIDGAGHVRIAGRFEGDVNIQGDLTVEQGAKLTGSIRAESVTIAGEVEGNIESAQKVELMATGILNGDLKAGTLTVASGSRMRGRMEFGWKDESFSGNTHGNLHVS
jgi:cytoskeletal protein CcmA (bactofilin family)